MIGAVLENDTVTNIIVMNEDQIEELSEGLGKEIVNGSIYGLQIGDVRQGENWVRNVGGDNIVLTPQEPQDYSAYTRVMAENQLLRESLDTAEKEKAVLTKQLDTYKMQLQKVGIAAMEAGA